MYRSDRKKLRITFNAPATLAFAGLCVAVQLVSMLTKGRSNRLLFSVYRASLSDPLTYVRCVLHILGHSGWNHLIGNMMFILLLGPVVEERYGTANTVLVILATAVVTGVIHVFAAPGVRLLGASGVVFAFILISSLTVREDRTIPVTFILVALLYFGQQVYQGLSARDHVSQLTHVAGGAVGTVLGFILTKVRRKERPEY